MTTITTLLSKRAHRARASAIRQVMGRAQSHPDMIFFGAGSPSADHFPYESIREAFNSVLADPSQAATALQYSDTEGLPALRDWVANKVSRTGVQCRRENVLIIGGSQQGLDLIGRMFVDEGSPVWVQSPTYPGALEAFSGYGATFRTLFEDEVKKKEPVSGLVYVIANSQNPSGLTMPVAQRLAALKYAHERSMPIVEDDAYAGIRFGVEELPSLLQLASSGRSVDDGTVIQLGTFSKSLVPGLRVGWVVAPSNLIQRLTWIKQATDLQVGGVAQMVALKLANMTTGAHIVMLASMYQRRRDAMLAALEIEFGTSATWTRPDGGFFIWMTINKDIDASAEIYKAINAGVVYIPGQLFHADGSGSNTLRLSFSNVTEERIGEGIRRLAGVLLNAKASRH